MTRFRKTSPNAPDSPIPAESAPDPEKITRSEARRGLFSSPVDPQHPPRPKRRALLLAAAALVVVSLGRAAWPVIDVSAVAQLVETVRLVQDQLTEMTTAKEALLGQVAVLTGAWDDLAGDPFDLNSVLDDPTISGSTDLPSSSDVSDAYDGVDADVVTQVLAAHQAATNSWNAQRGAWNDTAAVIEGAGDFLEAIESTASTQNAETTQGLGAQLDRQIAVSSASRDIAAQQLQLALSAEYRAARLERLQAARQAQLEQQALRIRSEIRDDLTQQEADFDGDAFDDRLYDPVMPSYGP